MFRLFEIQKFKKFLTVIFVILKHKNNMDPFTEKEITDCLKSIAVSLRNIDRKLDDMALSLRELNSFDEDEDDDIEVSIEEKTEDSLV